MGSSKSILPRFTLTTALTFFVASLALAQTPSINTLAPSGIAPTGSYSISDLETIDNVGGGVSYNIPLASLPPGRAGQTASLPLIYNSNLYDIYSVYIPTTDCNGGSGPAGYHNCLTFNPAGGWRYGYEYGLQLVLNPTYLATPADCSASGTYKYFQLSAVFPDGSNHLLHLYGATDDQGNGYYQEFPGATPSCPSSHTGDYTYYTADSTYVKVVFPAASAPTCPGGPPDQCWTNYPWTMYFPDGRQVTGIGEQSTGIIDSNGNKITFQRIADLSTTVSQTINHVLTDDLNRTITVVHQLSAQPGATVEDIVQQTGSNNTQLSWTIEWAPISVSNTGLFYPCNSGSCYLDASNFSVLSITFPTTSSGYQPVYQFSYADNNLPAPPGGVPGGWGQMNNVTLPSGASVHYNYLYDGFSYPDNASMFPPRNPVTKKSVTWCDESDATTPITSCSSSNPTTRTDVWTYTFGNTSSQVTGPDGGTTVTSFFDTSTDPASGAPTGGALAGQYAGLVFKTQAPDCSTVERQWAFNTPFMATNSTAETYTNPFVRFEFHSVAPALGPGQACATVQPTLAAVKYFTDDSNGNLVQEMDSDWMPYGNIVHGVAGDPTSGFSGGTPLRTLTQVPVVTTNPWGWGVDNANGYWNPSSPLLLSLMSCRATAQIGIANGAVTEFTYDSSGNVTQERDWDSTKSASQPTCSTTSQLTSSNAIVLNRSYDLHGNLTDSYDGNGNDTHLTYDSNALYLTTRSEASLRSTSYSIDFNTGLVNSQTDYNGLTQSYTRDNYGRALQLDESASSTLLRRTVTTFEDANRRVVTYSDRVAPGDQQLRSVTDYDQLGRVRLTRQLENTSDSVDNDTTGIKIQTRYGYSSPWIYQLASNPYRAGTSSQATGESTMGWTLAASDAQHGYAITTRASGAAAPAPPPALTSCSNSGSQLTCSSNNSTSVIDEAGVSRTNTVNGLGQLTSVVENGICQAPTSYGYDVLGNVTSVTHGNYQVACSLPPAINPGRTFVYDSLSRQQTASNAEGASISYTYDNNWNLKTRTDGQGRITTLAYDTLNRLTGKTYNDSTPPVTLSYLGATDFLTSVSSSASSYAYSNYDALGRPGGGTQTTPSNGTVYSFPSVIWTPQGQISSITYPSGRVITTSLDGAGRPSGATGQLGGVQTPYANGVTYAANSGLATLTSGDGLTRSIGYNAQLQMSSVSAGSLLTLQFGYSPTQNNGNLLSQTITRGSFTATQNYGYDGVNRLTSASEGSTWSQTYVYDNVGNRAVLSSSSLVIPDNTPQTTSTASVPYNASNHWTLAGYSSAGNQTAGNTTALRQQGMTYDAEERLIQWTDTNPSVSVSFTYDGDGRRVTKTTSAGTTVYIYDPVGNLAAEYGGPAPSVTGTLYLTQDHLSSTRLVTNAVSGQPQAVGCHDYLPFGEEISWGRSGAPCYSQTSDTFIKFTGKERDAETGLDFFQARYMSSAQGRFTSVDPANLGAYQSDPQSWNGYGYVGNSPLSAVDPDGTDTCYVDGFATDCGAVWQAVRNGSAAICPNNQCLLATPNGFYQFQAYANFSGYVQFGQQPYEIQEKVFGQTYTSYGNIQLASVGLLGTRGMNFLQNVTNSGLRNVIENLFRTGAQIGSGSTMDAIRNEVITGLPTGGKWHALKGFERRSQLLKLWRKGNLNPTDRSIAKRVLIDLQDALSGMFSELAVPFVVPGQAQLINFQTCGGASCQATMQ